MGGVRMNLALDLVLLQRQDCRLLCRLDSGWRMQPPRSVAPPAPRLPIHGPIGPGMAAAAAPGEPHHPPNGEKPDVGPIPASGKKPPGNSAPRTDRGNHLENDKHSDTIAIYEHRRRFTPYK